MKQFDILFNVCPSLTGAFEDGPKHAQTHCIWQYGHQPCRFKHRGDPKMLAANACSTPAVHRKHPLFLSFTLFRFVLQSQTAC